MRNLKHIITKEIENSNTTNITEYTSGYIDGMKYIRDVIVENYAYYELLYAIESLSKAGYLTDEQKKMAYKFLQDTKSTNE